jgi:hypothetical protein
MTRFFVLSDWTCPHRRCARAQRAAEHGAGRAPRIRIATDSTAVNER